MMSPAVRLLLLGCASVALMALVAWILCRVRTTPGERERKRRLMVHRFGRMADGIIIDVDPETVFYSYSAMGVDYQTSQDVGSLQQFLPADRNSLIGPVTLKYLPRNPANSIILCEEWSGLRRESKARSERFALGS